MCVCVCVCVWEEGAVVDGEEGSIGVHRGYIGSRKCAYELAEAPASG